MEREELIAFLRENLSVDVSLTDSHEWGGRYATSRVSLRLGDEIISSDDETIRIEEE
jgi:hypothetical protein